MSYMKPNVKLGAKNPKFAMYGHLLSLVGSLVAVVFGILNLIGTDFNGLIPLLGGIFILLVEVDKIKLTFLKDAMIRGVVWIILAVVASIGSWFTGLVIIFGGVFYIVYKLG